MLPVLEIFNSKKVILASGSPRRAEILRNIGLEFEVYESGFDESSLHNKHSHEDIVKSLALGKANHAFKMLCEEGRRPDFVIAADTIVTLGDRIYGKPHTIDVARSTLSELSNKTHEVYTGVALVDAFNASMSFHTMTKVKMAALKPETIDAYIKTGEPLDKAGAYGIQGLGATLVEKIEGDFYNVVGFPLFDFCQFLEEYGLQKV